MARRKQGQHRNWFGLVSLLAIFTFLGIYIQKVSGSYCANSLSCKESLTLKVENGAQGVFEGQKINAPEVDLAAKESSTKVLGEATLIGDKKINVDLTAQTLTATQGDSVFMQVPISSGKWFPTPDGDFTIWEKVRATRMSGGVGADYYNLPNVPFVMFFSGSGIAAGRGFSLHGTYWHNNFGHPMSHGCVNMRIVDAERLFYWADLTTTKITITGNAPI